MNNTSRTLLALAALSPAVMALDVKDDDLKLGIKLQLQVRAEKSWASGNDGNRYNVAEGVRDNEPDDMDFYIRRARVGFAGTWKGEYKFAYILRNDNQDKDGPGNSSTGTAITKGNGMNYRIPQTHVAYIERIIKQEEAGLEHGIRGGLDYAWFNGSSAVFSSSAALFPTERATASMLAPRGVGVGYKLNSKMIQFGLDIQNNTGDSTAGAETTTTINGSSANGEGLFYGSRIQIVPFDSDEKGHMKGVESFLGKEGTGLLISAEYGVNRGDNSVGSTANGTTTNTQGYGVEALYHLNAFTFLAEWRQTNAYNDLRTGADTRVVATAYLAQIGYAIPFGDDVIEPAFRWTRLNSDSGISEATEYGTSEFGTSGYSYDVGVNYYVHGHSNKIQLAFQHWRNEGGFQTPTALNNNNAVSPAKADIVRAQWQLSF